MGERPECIANRVAPALLELLQGHAETYPHLWKNVPVTWRRGTRGDMDNIARPCVVVTTQGTRAPEGAATLGSTRERIRVMLLLGTKDTANPEAAIEDLLADVKRALDSNRRLAGLDSAAPILPNGYIEVGSCDVGAEPDTSGKAGAELEVFVTYQWNQTDSP